MLYVKGTRVIMEDTNRYQGGGSCNTVTFSDARKHFADTMSRVTNNAEPVRVMRRDAPDIVMVDAGEYEAMLETFLPVQHPGERCPPQRIIGTVGARRSCHRGLLISPHMGQLTLPTGRGLNSTRLSGYEPCYIPSRPTRSVG